MADVIERLRTAHHEPAKLIAAGVPLGVVAARCGRSLDNLRHMLCDAAFRGLVAHYKKGSDNDTAN